MTRTQVRTSRGRRCGLICAGPANKMIPKEHESPSTNDLHIYLRKIRMNLKDARSLFDDTPPSGTCTDRGRRECGDLDGSTIWTQCQYPIRVVRSYETKPIRR